MKINSRWVVVGIVLGCCLAPSRALAQELDLVGVTVTPHAQSPNLRYRRAPESSLGARVELFFENRSATPVKLAAATAPRFDDKAAAELLADKAWTWHDSPAVWSEQDVTLAPHELTVFRFNGKDATWGVGTTHAVTCQAAAPQSFELAEPEAWLSAVTFLGRDATAPSVQPDRIVVHVSNASDLPLTIQSCRLWLPSQPGKIHAFRPQAELSSLDRFPIDGVVAPHDRGGFVADCGPLPLTYGVVEVRIGRPGQADRSLWAQLRIKREVLDISGGWVASDVNGRNSLTIESYLKTIGGMHINTGHFDRVPGYTDNDELYARFPLKLFNRLQPVKEFDTDQQLPRIHAVEFLGEPQYGGGRPVPPQEVWQALAPYQATRLPTTVTHSEERTWRYYAGLSDYPHYDAYRVTAPAADSFGLYDRWGGQRLRWGAPLETITDLTASLRELNRPAPIAYWSQGAHDGWGGSRGLRRGSPTPDELRAQAFHAISQRITSLYWFNLSYKSLLKFPDLIEPITRVNRELRIIEPLLLAGDVYAYRRETNEGQPDWDLSVVAGPDAALCVANDLSYVPDSETRVFQFRERADAELRFALPRWLADPQVVFRVDADGTHDVEYQIDSGVLTVKDKVQVAGVYVVANDPAWRTRMDAVQNALIDHEQQLGFQPGSDAEALDRLKAFLTAGQE